MSHSINYKVISTVHARCAVRIPSINFLFSLSMLHFNAGELIYISLISNVIKYFFYKVGYNCASLCTNCWCPLLVFYWEFWYKLHILLCFLFNLDVLFFHSSIFILSGLDFIIKWSVISYCSIFHLFLGKIFLLTLANTLSSVFTSEQLLAHFKLVSHSFIF